MSKTVGNELYCMSCGHEARTEHNEYECSKCGSEDVCSNSFIICDCGTTVYLDRFTNQCADCGKLYNKFGLELAPPEEWDPEDRIGSMGL